MRKVDKLWFVLTSEVLVNLSAGWIAFGLATIFASDKEILVKLGLLTVNVALGILSLGAAFALRKKREKND